MSTPALILICAVCQEPMINVDVPGDRAVCDRGHEYRISTLPRIAAFLAAHAPPTIEMLPVASDRYRQRAVDSTVAWVLQDPERIEPALRQHHADFATLSLECARQAALAEHHRQRAENEWAARDWFAWRYIRFRRMLTEAYAENTRLKRQNAQLLEQIAAMSAPLVDA